MQSLSQLRADDQHFEFVKRLQTQQAEYRAATASQLQRIKQLEQDIYRKLERDMQALEQDALVWCCCTVCDAVGSSCDRHQNTFARDSELNGRNSSTGNNQ